MTEQLQLSVTLLDKKALEAEVGSENLTAAPAQRSLEYREPGTILVAVSVSAVAGLAAWLVKPRDWSRDTTEITRTTPQGETLTYKHVRTSYSEKAPTQENIQALADAIRRTLKL